MAILYNRLKILYCITYMGKTYTMSIIFNLAPSISLRIHHHIVSGYSEVSILLL